MKKDKLLIFIITYKAKKRVYNVFKKINFDQLKKYKTHILISDDFSNDSTIFYSKKILKEFRSSKLNINKKNLGYGGNIKKCIEYGIKNKFKYAIMIHGDGQYSPVYIKSLISNLSKKNFYAVTGSRLKLGLKKAILGGMPLYKLIGNIFLTRFFNLTFKTNFKDAHTGLWAYRIEIFKKIKLKELPNTFNFDQQIRIQLINKNLELKEIPIKTIYADERSQLHVFYAIKFFFITMFYFLKLNHFFNKKDFS
jgi:hypothetical protein